jgi:hypothetical protein
MSMDLPYCSKFLDSVLRDRKTGSLVGPVFLRTILLLSPGIFQPWHFSALVFLRDWLMEASGWSTRWGDPSYQPLLGTILKRN